MVSLPQKPGTVWVYVGF